jgi:hypothetical protein
MLDFKSTTKGDKFWVVQVDIKLWSSSSVTLTAIVLGRILFWHISYLKSQISKRFWRWSLINYQHYHRYIKPTEDELSHLRYYLGFIQKTRFRNCFCSCLRAVLMFSFQKSDQISHGLPTLTLWGSTRKLSNVSTRTLMLFSFVNESYIPIFWARDVLKSTSPICIVVGNMQLSIMFHLPQQHRVTVMKILVRRMYIRCSTRFTTGETLTHQEITHNIKLLENKR